MLDKKYLISSGCSFTEGHLLGKAGSWATYFAENNNLELINLAKGGTGNEIITQNVINYATLNPEVAKDSLFIIQLSECLRFLICWDDFAEDTKIHSLYWHITPLQFLDSADAKKVTADGFKNWDKSYPLNRWIYDSRFQIAQLYTNITFSLWKTYNNIINFSNFCKANGYSYLIFDGINNHIPIKNNNNWYLKDSGGRPAYKLKVEDSLDDAQFFYKNHYPVIHSKIIEVVKSNPFYYNDMTLNDFILKDESYHKNNSGHPNELGSKLWAEKLTKIINETFGKSE
jgi:hypothetical protein